VWVGPDELAVLRWAAERFGAPLADVVRHALPGRVVDVERRAAVAGWFPPGRAPPTELRPTPRRATARPGVDHLRGEWPAAADRRPRRRRCVSVAAGAGGGPRRTPRGTGAADPVRRSRRAGAGARFRVAGRGRRSCALPATSPSTCAAARRRAGTTGLARGSLRGRSGRRRRAGGRRSLPWTGSGSRSCSTRRTPPTRSGAAPAIMSARSSSSGRGACVASGSRSGRCRPRSRGGCCATAGCARSSPTGRRNGAPGPASGSSPSRTQARARLSREATAALRAATAAGTYGVVLAARRGQGRVARLPRLR
jgi:primosomal protein N' (replication factor Y) (superfamily II helicase)